MPEFFGNGKYTMAMLAGDKFKSHGVGAVHGILIATRRAKTSMATKRNEFPFVAVRTVVHGTAIRRVE